MSSENISNKKVSGKRKNSYSFIIIMIITFSILFLYLISFINQILNEDVIETMQLEVVDITTSDWVDGLIVRNEDVYASDSAMAGNYLQTKKVENDRVTKGEEIATIHNSNIEISNNELDSSHVLVDSLIGEDSKYASQFEIINDSIKSNIDNFKDDKYDDLYVLRSNLDEEIEARNQLISGEGAEFIEDNEEEIESSVSQVGSIAAIHSGIFSYELDNRESALTFDTMETLTEEDIEEESEYFPNHVIEISDAQDLFRVVASNVWYICAYFPSESVVTNTTGDEVFLYLDNNSQNTTRATVYYKNELDDETYIIYEIQNNMIDYINKRNISIALDKEVYDSILIPDTAIVNKEMLLIPSDYILDDLAIGTAVIKKNAESAVSTPITVFGYTEDMSYAYVEKAINPLLLGDVIIEPGEDAEEYTITETETIQGVYVANDGTAKYRKVIINDNIDTTDGYIYIYPNANVKADDRIVVDSSKISEGELLNKE